MVTLRLNRGSTIKNVAEKSDCGLFIFFFLFWQFNQVAQLLCSYEVRLELKRGGWVLAQSDTLKFLSFSVHVLNNIHVIVMQGRQRNLQKSVKQKT